MMLRSPIATSFATLAFLLAPMVSSAAAPPPLAPPGAKCARATYIRPADGAIVTRTVCVLTESKGGVR
jgi:hypothetical protein